MIKRIHTRIESMFKDRKYTDVRRDDELEEDGKIENRTADSSRSNGVDSIHALMQTDFSAELETATELTPLVIMSALTPESVRVSVILHHMSDTHKSNVPVDHIRRYLEFVDTQRIPYLFLVSFKQLTATGRNELNKYQAIRALTVYKCPVHDYIVCRECGARTTANAMNFLHKIDEQYGNCSSCSGMHMPMKSIKCLECGTAGQRIDAGPFEWESWLVDDLLREIESHVLQPRHVLLDDATKEKLLKEQMIKEENLMLIESTDAMARRLRARVGQVMALEYAHLTDLRRVVKPLL